MNVKQAVAIVVLVAVPLFVAAAQHQHDVQSADTAKSLVMAGKMGEATFEKYLDGYHLQVWVITQEEHKKMMKENMTSGEMKHGMMGMGHRDRQAMMSGTHHVMVTIVDTTTNKPPEAANVDLTVQSPSKKSTSVKLSEMMGHFGGVLTLDEKGDYLIAINAKIADTAHEAEFKYEVK